MQIRNIAIIAHVDHGKTTLIDGMLKQTKLFRDNQAEMNQSAILDQNDLEREKGITILAKNTAVEYNGVKINIIDTPGHADFGGEVERVISMADGALLIVDAAEGPLAQTKFVLDQAFKQNLKIIVVINKIDRRDAEPERVLAEIEELFLDMANNEDQLNFPVIFANGRAGKTWNSLPSAPDDKGDLRPLFDEIIKSIPGPIVDLNSPFKMQVANLDHDNYKGNYAIGKITSGKVRKGQQVVVLDEDKKIANSKVEQLFVSKGLDRSEVEVASCGDIIAITGIANVSIGHTIASPEVTEGFPRIIITEPTLKIYLGPNSSPFVGKEGEFCTARQLQNRLDAEKKTNLGLRIKATEAGGFMVAGRGELHLAVLIETMRREGYEMEVGKPQAILKEIDGKMHEPVEELSIEIDKEFVGIITEELGKRRAEMKDSLTNSHGVAKMVYEIPSKNLLGFRSEILTKTRGNGLFNTRFVGYKPLTDSMKKLRNGVLIASEGGISTSYAIESVQQRGVTFIGPGVNVYEGMVIGIAKTREDIEMNISKSKKLTNFRSNAEATTVLSPPKILSLEQSLDFIEEDELLEITPKNLRIRKRLLTRRERVKSLRRG